jgi:transcriptional regulator with XRE-family HTH domain
MKLSVIDRIFEVLKQNEVKDAQLSRTLGVSRTTISEWRNGKNSPSPKLILKFLFHFPEVDANWLIRGKPAEKSGQTATVNYNVQAGTSAMVNEHQNELKTENSHLKQLLKEKEEQIKLLKQLLNR